MLNKDSQFGINDMKTLFDVIKLRCVMYFLHYLSISEG